MAEEMVMITREEYEGLLESRRWEMALFNAGVDNWGGYDFAKELYQESLEDEGE